MAAINVSNTSETSSGAKQTLSLQSRILDYFNGDENCDVPSKTTQNWYTNNMFNVFSSLLKTSFYLNWSTLILWIQFLSTSRHKGEDPRSCLTLTLFCYISKKKIHLILRVKKQVFLQSNRQAKFTPRAIARIMHGVGSPAFPNSIWSKTHFWYDHQRLS